MFNLYTNHLPSVQLTPVSRSFSQFVIPLYLWCNEAFVGAFTDLYIWLYLAIHLTVHTQTSYICIQWWRQPFKSGGGGFLISEGARHF